MGKVTQLKFNESTKDAGRLNVEFLSGAKLDLPQLREKWQWRDATVDRAEVRHLLHFLKPAERIHVVNELCRVLKPGAEGIITIPFWAANKSYADLDVVWPPVVEMWFFFLNAEWRAQNKPTEKRYTCDFEFPPTIGYVFHPLVASRHADYQQTAAAFYKEAIQDIGVTLVKR